MADQANQITVTVGKESGSVAGYAPFHNEGFLHIATRFSPEDVIRAKELAGKQNRPVEDILKEWALNYGN